MLINSMLPDSKFLFLYVPFIASVFSSCENEERESLKLYDGSSTG
jgi:hypothetical protein